MGLDKPQRKPVEKKQVELSGHESAQRKRFLRAEADDSEQSQAARGWTLSLIVEEGATEAASALMTWAPHQERSPHILDGNGTEKTQLLMNDFLEDSSPT